MFNHRSGQLRDLPKPIGVASLIILIGAVWATGNGSLSQHPKSLVQQVSVPAALSDSKRLSWHDKPVYFNLDDMVSGPTLPETGGLSLDLLPMKQNQDLVIHLRVGNSASVPKQVVPLDPLFYQVEFRDNRQGNIDPYPLPPVNLRALSTKELTTIWPGNYLGAFCLCKDFFKKFTQDSNISCRVHVNESYTVITASKEQKLSRFQLTSDWVSIAG